MLKLMKLEWKKNNIGKYIRTAVILTAVSFGFAVLSICNVENKDVL